ncbi:MAG: hypothetical protein ACRDV9_11860 [Acidimicrobiia bacterium]
MAGAAARSTRAGLVSPVALLLLSLMLVGFGPIGPAIGGPAVASRPDNQLGYSGCVWTAGSLLRVKLSDQYPIPPEFTPRIDEAMARWNQVLETTGRRPSMVRSIAPESEIVVEYRPFSPDPAAVAETYLRRQGDLDESPDITRCPDRRDPTYTMASARIVISPRDDWFAGPDDQAATWSGCSDQGFRGTNPGLCSDLVDFGSTIVHELGHSLVLYHPESLDDIDGTAHNSPSSASSSAGCLDATGDFATQATMCQEQGAWRSDQRTFEAWDIETAQRHLR